MYNTLPFPQVELYKISSSRLCAQYVRKISAREPISYAKMPEGKPSGMALGLWLPHKVRLAVRAHSLEQVLENLYLYDLYEGNWTLPK